MQHHDLPYPLGTQRHYNHGLAGCTLFYYLASGTKRNSTHPNSTVSTEAAVTGSYLGDLHCSSFSLSTLVLQELHEISLIWASKICHQEQTHQSDVTSYVPVTQSVFPWSVQEAHKCLWILSELTLTAYYFRNFALTSLVLSAADERSRQTEGGWEAANILKVGEKRCFHRETCRRINLPSSKCPIFNLLLSLLLVLTSFFPHSWTNTSNFSSTLKWPPRAVGEALIKL